MLAAASATFRRVRRPYPACAAAYGLGHLLMIVPLSLLMAYAALAGALAAAATGIAVVLPLEVVALLASDAHQLPPLVETLTLGLPPAIPGLLALLGHGALLLRAERPGALLLRTGLVWLVLGLALAAGVAAMLSAFPPTLRVSAAQPEADLGGVMLCMTVIAGEGLLALVGLLFALAGAWRRRRAASRPA